MNKKMKVVLISIFVGLALIAIVLGGLIVYRNYIHKEKEEITQLKELPKPEITGGQRGQLGIDKNINESVIDEYLNREDSVYRDMRMLEDPGNYEAIGGDRYLSGYIEGFEVIPLPYIIPVSGLPTEVGDTYTGTTLFYDNNGTYVANYKESMDIIEEIFPKDKVIFLMCGGGGYAGNTKDFLVTMGWDSDKIYNIGGYWYYTGEHDVKVEKLADGKYDFSNVPYHDIEFEKLTKTQEYKAPVVKVTQLKLNTQSIEIEENTSFKLNAIILPNEATDKRVEWTSSNIGVAKVNSEGLVEAVGPGTATITAKSVSEEKVQTCTVKVTKKEINLRVKLDDLPNEYNEFESLDALDLAKKYFEMGMSLEEEEPLILEAGKRRAEILNNLIAQKNTFILLYLTKYCEEDYKLINDAEKILKENLYTYFLVGNGVTTGEKTLDYANLNINGDDAGSIFIFKNGQLYARTDPNKDNIQNEKDLRNWLSKYLYLN